MRELMTRHGHCCTARRPPVYTSWRNMIQRCTNPRDLQFRNYGGRGIRVCEAWRLDFVAFLRDMGARPPGTSLDRIDNEGNYEPGNCRWATRQEQQANKRNTRRLTFQGQTLPVAAWARRFGIPSDTLAWRLGRGGWSAARALAPVST
jgi:hypothetical protein